MKTRTIAVSALALFAATFANAQNDEERMYYQLLEDKAPLATKAKLTQLRSEIVSHGYHFTVGVTSKLDSDLKLITGYVKPTDFAAQVAAHQARLPIMLQNQKIQESLPRASARINPGLASHVPIQIVPSMFDWRTSFIVTKVKDQGQAGTCWAFASCEALESSDLLKNGQYACVATQQAVTCSGGGTVNGGWHGPVLDYFVDHGATYEDGGICPYLAIQGSSAQKTQWGGLMSVYYAAAWDYVHPGGGMANTSEMKYAILAHGPIVTAIDARYFSGYTGGVLDIPSTSSDHVVDIVGWDDSKSAWIIKNSWGHDWGISCGYAKEKGYCYVKYGDCNVGDSAAWIDARVGQPVFPYYY